MEEFKSTTKCALCRKEVPISEIFCSNCGYPANGTEPQKLKYKQQRAARKAELQNVKKKVNRSAVVLFIIGALNTLMGMLIAEDDITLIVYIIIGAIFIGIGFWVYKAPLPAALTGLIFYITLIVLSAILDPMSLVKGILWKVLIVSSLIYSISNAKLVKKMEEELEVDRDA